MTIEELKRVDGKDRFSGIYALYNRLTSKVYVGSSVDIYGRVYGDHINLLEKGKHNNRYLQFAYDKDKENFIYVILEAVVQLEDLLVREQYWMDSFISYDSNYGYNLAPTAGSMLGFKHSSETRQLIGKIQLGRKASEETRRKISIANSGENGYWYGKKFSQEHIEKIRTNSLKLIHTEETKRKISEAGKGRKIPEESIRRSAKSRMVAIVQLDLNGNLIREWESATSACKGVNVKNRGNIVACCNGKRRQSNGFMWMYKSDYVECIDKKKPIFAREKMDKGRSPREVVQLTLNGEYIKNWISIKEAVETLDFKSISGIYECCNGKKDKYRGFKWMYKEDYEVFYEK